MGKMVALSIVIPNFNSGELLRSTLESIFSTTSIFSFEVLIIDNVSTDRPSRILDDFQFDNLYFFSSPDSGIYDAMNKGIQKAKGEWIYFLGAGDTVFLENLNLLPLNDLRWRVLYGDVYLVQKDRIYDGEFSFLKLMKRNISHQAMFYRSSIFGELGYFDTSFKITADYVFNLQLFTNIRHTIKYFPVLISSFYGQGISDTIRDSYFEDNKVSIINGIVIRNLSYYALKSLLAYYVYYFRNFLRYKFG